MQADLFGVSFNPYKEFKYSYNQYFETVFLISQDAHEYFPHDYKSITDWAI